MNEVLDKLYPKGKSRPPALHFNDFSHERLLIGSGILGSQNDWAGVLVMSDTTKVPKRLQDAEQHRFDTMRHVIERCLWKAEEWKEELTIYIDQAKPRFKLELFREYLVSGYKDADNARTNWGLLDIGRVNEAEPEEQLGLCIADGLAYAAHRYFNRDDFGQVQPAYFESFRRRLWRGESPDQTDRMRLHPTLFEHGYILLPASQIWSIRREFPQLIEWEREYVEGW